MKRLRKDTEYLLRLLGIHNTEVSILLTNDKKIKDLNRMYRHKNTTTDVLSFPMDKPSDHTEHGEQTLLGDIVINVHMAKRLGSERGWDGHAIMRQLLIHGLLHLAGYDHEKNSYQRRKMYAKENQLLNALSQLD
ncbi:endoribonuclease YbeY [bacterium BMS3Abin07]|nr:endoribonuclease YbeY [bacterium BMS3Abin07]GBE31501.1 endoribonuclease YbeY [bacterium BMS3Bbin05]